LYCYKIGENLKGIVVTILEFEIYIDTVLLIQRKYDFSVEKLDLVVSSSASLNGRESVYIEETSWRGLPLHRKVVCPFV
jgi:hypothetical protein